MITFAWYLLKVIICSGILCGYYFLALRNKVYHRWNRFFLLCSVILALFIPLIKINILAKAEVNTGSVIQILQTISYQDDVVVELGRNSGFHINNQNLATSVYFLVLQLFSSSFFSLYTKLKS